MALLESNNLSSFSIKKVQKRKRKHTHTHTHTQKKKKIQRFLASLRGHVGSVYQVAWSSDSRLLVSGSKDSTLKVWDVKSKKMKVDLPGHADEVYSVDWSPDGDSVASGGKDRNMKL